MGADYTRRAGIPIGVDEAWRPRRDSSEDRKKWKIGTLIKWRTRRIWCRMGMGGLRRIVEARQA